MADFGAAGGGECGQGLERRWEVGAQWRLGAEAHADGEQAEDFRVLGFVVGEIGEEAVRVVGPFEDQGACLLLQVGLELSLDRGVSP